LSGKITNYSRTIASFFDFLADVGGLQDGLYFVFNNLLGIFAPVFVATR